MIVAVARVKDEADIIEATVTRMLAQVDAVVVEDNGSTDGTLDILRALPITVLEDDTVGYYQSRAMTRLAAFAALEMGADRVVPFDADEVWITADGRRVADVLADHPGASIIPAVLYDHVATGVDPGGADATVRIGWRRRTPAPLPKVAVRPYPRVTIHQGNHGADFGQTVAGLLEVRHFPYRSAEQMTRKARNGAAAYAATDLPEDVGKHWRDYGRLTDEQIAEVFQTYFWSADPESDPTLIYDPAP
jgi:glycosyltransferase involved in cell wall biosynthesis